MIDLSTRILNQNQDGMQILQTSFYWWLEKGNWHKYFTEARLNYLEDQFNYRLGATTCNQHCNTNLKIIYKAFTDEHKTELFK